MKLQFNKGFGCAWRAALCGASALLLVIGCPLSSRSQQAAPPSAPAASPPDKPTVSPQENDASANALANTQDGIRKGTLFYATAPLSEQALRQADGTPAGVSFTVPLTVDRKQNRLFVQALVNSRKVHLILDTAGGPLISLNETTARGIELTGKSPIQTYGGQGYAPATLGLTKSLTLGRLVLQQVPTTVSQNVPFYNCTLGLSVFEHYRVTLDFAANTMTLTRGGVPVPSPGGAALSIPFGDANGYIFIPDRVLGQAGWAILDSGSDENGLSFKAAKAAATQLPSSDAKTTVADRQVGLGNTPSREFKTIGLKSPVPISMNTDHDAVEFNTTSWAGASNLDALDSVLGAQASLNALLGFPFLLQFQRVIIDYPSHTLILQYPAHNTFIKVDGSPTDHDKPWPGYKWRQVGYAWIEVPDGKSAPKPLLTIVLPPQMTATQTTSTTTTTTEAGTKTNTTTKTIVIFPPLDGNITVSVNWTKTVYSLPPKSIIRLDADGSVHILPPGSSRKGKNDHSFYIGPLDGPGK